jgi:integrase
LSERKPKWLYDKDIKEEYLETLPKETADVYRFGLYRSSDTEDVIGKNLYNFSTDEIKSVLIDANHSTFNSIRLTLNVIESYIKWAIETGKVNSNINPAKTIKNDELKTYLTNKKILFSEEEIRNMMSEMVNAQDRIIFQLIFFEGINGYEHSEILNLTKSDIDWTDRILHVKDDKHGKRDVRVSEETLSLIEKAIEQTHYQNKNGMATGKTPELPLMENEYVLRTSATRDENLGKADKHLIYRRISAMKDNLTSTNHNLKYLTAKSIEKSGMIAEAVRIFNQTNELGTEELKLVAEKFGVRQVKINGYDVYNYSILRQFINADTIMDLYNINIE